MKAFGPIHIDMHIGEVCKALQFKSSFFFKKKKKMQILNKWPH